MIKQTLFLMFGFTLSLLLTACGSAPSDQPELGTVSGVITMDGTPLANANVRFYPEKGRASAAKTDDSGSYELVYIRDEMGAMIGKHSVKVSTLDEDNDPFGNQGSETVPEKYNKQTTLEATVEPGDNTINFDLESK